MKLFRNVLTIIIWILIIICAIGAGHALIVSTLASSLPYFIVNTFLLALVMTIDQTEIQSEVSDIHKFLMHVKKSMDDEENDKKADAEKYL